MPTKEPELLIDPVENPALDDSDDLAGTVVEPAAPPSDPFDEMISEIMGDPERARAIVMRALGTLAGASFGAGAAAAPAARPTGYFDLEGRPVNFGEAPPGMILTPAQGPMTKKVWTRTALEALPYLGEMVTWRPSNKLAPLTGWNGIIYRTPFGKKITTPRVIQEVHEASLDEAQAFEDGVTIAPAMNDQAIPVLRDSNGGIVTGGFDAHEVYRTVNAIRESGGHARLPFPDLATLEDLPELPDAT
jgi:hypothetical protein